MIRKFRELGELREFKDIEHEADIVFTYEIDPIKGMIALSEVKELERLHEIVNEGKHDVEVSIVRLGWNPKISTYLVTLNGGISHVLISDSRYPYEWTKTPIGEKLSLIDWQINEFKYNYDPKDYKKMCYVLGKK